MFFINGPSAIRPLGKYLMPIVVTIYTRACRSNRCLIHLRKKGKKRNEHLKSNGTSFIRSLLHSFLFLLFFFFFFCVLSPESPFPIGPPSSSFNFSFCFSHFHYFFFSCPIFTVKMENRGGRFTSFAQPLPSPVSLHELSCKIKFLLY